MRTICAFGLLLALAAAPALAQSATGAPVSFGGDVGLFAPFSSGSSSSLTGRFTADVYAWGPTAMRFALGFANPWLGDAPFQGHADTLYLTAGAIRKFERAGARPYGHAGVGIYHLSGKRSSTDLGLDFGGGFEVPLGMKHLLLTPELTGHVISGNGPRFSLALTLGLHTRPR